MKHAVAVLEPEPSSQEFHCEPVIELDETMQAIVDYKPPLMRLMRRYEKNPDRLEDLFQDLLLKIIAFRAKGGVIREMPITFAGRTAINTGKNHARYSSRKPQIAAFKTTDAQDEFIAETPVFENPEAALDLKSAFARIENMHEGALRSVWGACC